jgi:hypothetical protein
MRRITRTVFRAVIALLGLAFAGGVYTEQHRVPGQP